MTLSKAMNEHIEAALRQHVIGRCSDGYPVSIAPRYGVRQRTLEALTRRGYLVASATPHGITRYSVTDKLLWEHKTILIEILNEHRCEAEKDLNSKYLGIREMGWRRISGILMVLGELAHAECEPGR